MFQAATGLSHQWSNIILAIGGLGTAAYGLVDASKGFWGGISNRGFGDIKKVISQFIPPSPANDQSALTLTSILTTLRANWLNGMALADQKLVAKALIKLELNESTSNRMAAATGLDPNVLGQIAAKLSGKLDDGNGKPPLLPIEADVYGRFDLLLSAILDQGYQRADQRYRNSAKLLAVPIAVVLAVAGAWSITHPLSKYQTTLAILGGLLATPLAPVAKDLASAVQQASKLAQSWKS